MTANDSVLNRLIDINQLSDLWNIPRATLYNWVNQGRIPYVKIGRCLRFDPAELAELLAVCTIKAAGKR
jgi:excisionase family DNA binding protein